MKNPRFTSRSPTSLHHVTTSRSWWWSPGPGAVPDPSTASAPSAWRSNSEAGTRLRFGEKSTKSPGIWCCFRWTNGKNSHDFTWKLQKLEIEIEFLEEKNFIRSDWRRKNWIWDWKNYPYPKPWKKNSNPTMLTSKYILISFVEIPSWGQCSTPVCIARGPTELSWLLTQWLCPSFRGAWGRNSRMSKQFVNLGRGNRRAQGAKARDLSIFEPRAGNASFVF